MQLETRPLLSSKPRIEINIRLHSNKQRVGTWGARGTRTVVSVPDRVRVQPICCAPWLGRGRAYQMMVLFRVEQVLTLLYVFLYGCRRQHQQQSQGTVQQLKKR